MSNYHDDGYEKEVWEMTQADIERMVEEKAAQKMQPVAEQLQRQGRQIHENAVRDALAAAPSLLRSDPNLLAMTEDPESRAVLEQALSLMPTEALDDERAIRGAAYTAWAYLPAEKRRSRRPEPRQPEDEMSAWTVRTARQLRLPRQALEEDIPVNQWGMVSINEWEQAQEKKRGGK